MLKRVLTLVVGSLLMVACGPGAKIDGREGAAQALLAASQPTKATTESSATPVDSTGGIGWNCPEGGTAKISGASIIGGGTHSLSAGVTLSYNKCGLARSDVGVAVYNGALTLSRSVELGSSAVGFDQTFKGKVLVEGAYDDFLEADITQKINVGDLGLKNSGVSMTLKGTITTSEGSFTYDEMLTVMSGTINAKIEANKK